MKHKGKLASIGLLLVAAVVTYLQGGDVGAVLKSGLSELNGSSPQSDVATPRSGGSSNAEHVFDQLFAAGRSDVIVTDSARIKRVLSDDTKGSQHQRLLVEAPSGLTVLIAHNIDLAPRVPNPKVGDIIGFKGEYEWTEKGGVLHWTHHDPAGRHPGGWLEYQGRRYE